MRNINPDKCKDICKASRQKNYPLGQTVNVEVVYMGLDSSAFLPPMYENINRVTLHAFTLPILCEKNGIAL